MTRAILDELLVLRSQDGCADAFNQLLARWHGAVLRHAARIAGNDAARDVAQEAWVVVVRQLGRLEDPARFAGWLLRIVAGVAVDAVRARTRRGRAEAAATASRHAHTTEAALCDSSDSSQRLRDAVAALPPDQRLPVELFYLEELTVQEIADVLSIPLGTVKSRLFQARAVLRERLSD
jgi:RNA polymerase sigma-70 factor (ECF subfamily)